MVESSPNSFSGNRFSSLLYSNMYEAAGGQMLPRRVAFQRTRLGPLQIASMRPLPETICNC